MGSFLPDVTTEIPGKNEVIKAVLIFLTGFYLVVCISIADHEARLGKSPPLIIEYLQVSRNPGFSVCWGRKGH